MCPGLGDARCHCQQRRALPLNLARISASGCQIGWEMRGVKIGLNNFGREIDPARAFKHSDRDEASATRTE